MKQTHYDYIIIGGGSSGCVMANRLTDGSNAQVLLLEAGGKDSHPYIHMPVGFSKLTAGPRTWGFNTVPQRHANNQKFHMHRAKFWAADLLLMQKFLLGATLPIMIVGLEKKEQRAGLFQKFKSTLLDLRVIQRYLVIGMELRGH